MEQDPGAAPALPDMSDIAGPYVIGHLLSFFFFGILSVQVYLYFHAFNKSDPMWLRGLVMLIFLLELSFQALEINMAWVSLGAGWGNLPKILRHTVPANSLPLLTGIVTSMVHGFYVWRIVILAKNYISAVLVVLLSIGQMAMTAVVCGHLIQHANDGTVEALHTTTKYITIWLTFAASADIIISVSMVVFLARAAKKTSYSETSSRLQKIMKYSVETGTVTSCGALIDVILFLTLPNSSWHFVVFLSLSKIYASTLVATLNSRMSLTTARTASQPTESAQMYRSALWRDTERGGGADGNPVHIQKTTVVLSDSHPSGMELSSVKLR